MPRKHFLTLACLLYGLSLLAVGLWPFNFRTDNHAVLLPNGGGLRFDAPAERSKQDLGGVVFTPRPLVCGGKGGCEAGTLSIEIDLSAENELSSCIKRILEVRKPDGSVAFYIGQWKAFLIVRSFNAPTAKGEPYREIGADGVLAAGRRSLVTIVSSPQGADIHCNGQLIKSYPDVRLLGEKESLEGHRLYFGNSPDLNCPWAGRVMGFALIGKELASAEVTERRTPAEGGPFSCSRGDVAAVACYRFDGSAGESIADLSGSANDLWIPARLVFDKRPLGLPDGQHFSASDVTVNLLGFVPFGFLVCLRLLAVGKSLAWRSFFFTTAMGFGASLAIELTQVWLPGRDSSFLDLTTNTLGSAIGAAMGCHFGRSCGGWFKKTM
jgi:hypothetical protein